jgi:hypothetical protein
VIRTEEEHLAHYGVLRRSGRYPWGSSSSQTTRNRSFLDVIDIQKKQGMSETQIAESHGITTTQLRASKSIARAEQKQTKILAATRYREKGWSHQAIAERMGLPGESSVRSLLREGEKDKADALQTTANMLKKEVDKKKYIDVGVGVHHQINVTRTRLDTAVAVLREQGYTLHQIKVQQLGTGKFTNMRILAKPGTPLQEVQRNRGQIKQIQHYSDDMGRSFLGIDPPISVSQRRIGINYKEDGGDKADGVIYVRPGVKNLSIGKGNYSQVRIMVDGTHYLKGMAVYKEGLPEGTDLVFNTSKKNTGRKKDAMKEIEKDADNPFGSIVEQIRDPKTKKVTSAMNIVNEEGNWDKWNRTLSSQMLSKQDPKLVTQQLDLTHERRQKEYDEIVSLTNATVRKDLLEKFADQTDAAAVHLKAANMTRQATKVILPIPSVKETEVYAPSFRDGERVVLIRHPHGGTFEIPELTVNNRNRDAKRTLGTNSQDAIGINHKVAQHLSGADFDGDTVLVIPNTRGSIQRTPALKELKEFDPQTYKIPKDSPIIRMNDSRKQQEMGKISNLITDMTIGGAKTDELARAVKHSMVVIDAVNHELDFKQSEKDHGIASLKEKYQGGKQAGAKTLISRARSPVWIPQKQLRAAPRGGPIDPVTGKKVFEPTGYLVPGRGKEAGTMVPRKQESKRLIETEDAFSLIDTPGTRMERIYAEHSNKLKAMANTARKESFQTKSPPMNPSAKTAYSKQVVSLNAKLDNAERNAPYERQAQLLANVVVSQKKQANPHMPKADEKKIKQQALNEARIRTRAKKDKILITQSEWDAIQAGAISNDKLKRILNNSDIDTVKALAMPKHAPKMTSTMKARASRMLASGYTQADVADALGVGLTTLKVGISE